MTKSDPATGVKCFTIGGRMVERRQRCLGMTDEERRWRAQWLKDQVLTPEEPKYVPEYYKATTNVFRRLWKTPMNAFEKFLGTKVGPTYASVIRFVVGKGIIAIGLAYVGTYYAFYHTNDFTRCKSIDMFITEGVLTPDHPNYHKCSRKQPQDYYNNGFYSSVLAK